MQRPGKVNFPVVVTSLVPISARLFMILATAVAFVFMGEGAIVQVSGRAETACPC